MGKNFTAEANLQITKTGTVTPFEEHQLWATVLLTVVHDLCATSPFNWKEQREAERWVGSFPSRDFREVVSLAGLDPDAVWERLNLICTTPARSRSTSLPGEELRGAA